MQKQHCLQGRECSHIIYSYEYCFFPSNNTLSKIQHSLFSFAAFDINLIPRNKKRLMIQMNSFSPWHIHWIECISVAIFCHRSTLALYLFQLWLIIPINITSAYEDCDSSMSKDSFNDKPIMKQFVSFILLIFLYK